MSSKTAIAIGKPESLLGGKLGQRRQLWVVHVYMYITLARSGSARGNCDNDIFPQRL